MGVSLSHQDQLEADLTNRFSNAFGRLGSLNASGDSMKPSNPLGAQSSQAPADLSLFQSHQSEAKRDSSPPSPKEPPNKSSQPDVDGDKPSKPQA